MRSGLLWLAALGVLAALPAAVAAEVEIVATPSPVTKIVETAAGAYFRTAKGVFKMAACDEAAICFVAANNIAGDLEPAPQGGLPDGKVFTSGKGDIRRAWYGRPTGRYGHGVLGDAIEAGSLIAETKDGSRFELVLDDDHVFEDIHPRLFDLDGNGTNEVVTIRSSLKQGAAIAIYGLADGALFLAGESRDIGRANRWLNIAGIADYRGAGTSAIAWVETPHIGGILRMGIFDGKKFETLSMSYNGFSNHFIGSRELALSATTDVTGDGVPDLVLPSADRTSLVIVATTGRTDISLPGRVGHAIVAIEGRIVTADSAGRLLVVRR